VITQMRVQIEGEFLGAEEWDFNGQQGFTISILQGNSTAKMSVRKDEAPAFPERMTPVIVHGVVRPGYEGKGFKVGIESFAVANGRSKAPSTT
jgi:hypothetical protein